MIGADKVSIVSIQADQSRQQLCVMLLNIQLLWFQSYQFRQINPDYCSEQKWYTETQWFQSYQFRQINPDKKSLYMTDRCCNSFNRINSGRSIPTWIRRINMGLWNNMFQSYQFRQINPDREHLIWCLFWMRCFNRFNRINSGRSIPTATSGKPVVARFSEAEWRNLFF